MNENPNLNEEEAEMLRKWWESEITDKEFQDYIAELDAQLCEDEPRLSFPVLLQQLEDDIYDRLARINHLDDMFERNKPKKF